MKPLLRPHSYPCLRRTRGKTRKNSQVVVSQVKGEAQVKDPMLQKYLVVVKENLAFLTPIKPSTYLWNITQEQVSFQM